MRKQHGFVHNMKQEKFIINAILKDKQIPNHRVMLPIAEDAPIIVSSHNNLSNSYLMYSLDCEWACCDCRWALKGDICKHEIKILKIMVERTIKCNCGFLKGVVGGGLQNMLQLQVDFRRGGIFSCQLMHIEIHNWLPTLGLKYLRFSMLTTLLTSITKYWCLESLLLQHWIYAIFILDGK